MMKKIICAVCVGLLTAGAAHADVIVNLPPTGNTLTNTTSVLTNISDPNSDATFDVTYTITAVSGDTGVVVGVGGPAGEMGTSIGVGSDNDAAGHFNTLEGNGATVPNPEFDPDDPDNPDNGPANLNLGGEGLSFTGLTISNFMDNGSGVVVSDITNLQFDDLTFNAVANNQDGVNFSYEDFGVNTINQNLNNASTGGSPFAFILPTPTDGSLIDSIFLEPDTAGSGNRWNISGIQISFDSPAAVPEPTSACLLGLGAIALITQRRKRI